MNKEIRKAGVLLHPTSIPGKFGIGDFGENAYSLIDIFEKNHISLWQVLPLGPTGYGDSPYASRSTFAGNELLIDIKTLYLDGYLDLEDMLLPGIECDRVDYGAAKEAKMPLLFKAAGNFLQNGGSREYEAFLKEKKSWLEDYALYQALCSHFNDSRWFSSWNDDLKFRKKKALDEAKKQFADEIALWKVLQYFFFKQWKALKVYANDHGVSIVGDIPIFVAPDSVDAWTNTKLFKMDENLALEKASGVPPDAFSATGQLWGNPVYRWEEHEKTGFAWWIERIKGTLELCDLVRIDHFRGFAACWEVPSDAENAINGEWVPSPGQKLLDAVKAKLGELPLIAEDLGVITPDVEELRDGNHLPGMKILQFAFGFENGKFNTDNGYLPHNIGYNSVVYTGTHDNDTTLGWYRSSDEGTKDIIRRYFETAEDDVVYKIIRSALMTKAKYCIIPMQDILGLGTEARMNVPSTCGSSNWSWKMDKKYLDNSYFARFGYYTELYGRA
jgi:4-alpha-glucanotransferase